MFLHPSINAIDAPSNLISYRAKPISAGRTLLLFEQKHPMSWTHADCRCSSHCIWQYGYANRTEQVLERVKWLAKLPHIVASYSKYAVWLMLLSFYYLSEMFESMDLLKLCSAFVACCICFSLEVLSCYYFPFRMRKTEEWNGFNKQSFIYACFGEWSSQMVSFSAPTHLQLRKLKQSCRTVLYTFLVLLPISMCVLLRHTDDQPNRSWPLENVLHIYIFNLFLENCTACSRFGNKTNEARCWKWGKWEREEEREK